MIDLIDIGNNHIEKHVKYKEQYLPDEIYWGLGIENEVYLEFEKKIQISKKEFIENHKRERYSVDYYSNYKKKELETAFKSILKIMGNKVLEIPLLINSHSFTKTDILNNSKTMFTKGAEPNPKFLGETLIEYISKYDSYFNIEKNIEYENGWIFDGDTIEFISTKFYNKNLVEIIDELEENKNIFIKKLNNILKTQKIFEDYGSINIMKENYAFSSYLTNINNIGMFNNGTIHLNLTLPTKLNKQSLIIDKIDFIEKHKRAIKIIQWFEPLIICVYGSPDPFATLYNFSERDKYSNCSQRNVISRYISIGTYDTDLMESGKILTKKVELMSVNNLKYWWFNRFHTNSAYQKLDQIGLDINFNKHWNHGIEIRFLDHISDKNLVYECFEFIIYLMDYILEIGEEINNNIYLSVNPILNKEWNDITYRIMKSGINTELNDDDKNLYSGILEIKFTKENPVDLYYEILNNLRNKYNPMYKKVDEFEYLLNNKIRIPNGIFSSLTLSKNIINTENNINNKKIDLTESNKSIENSIDLLLELKIKRKNNLIKNYILNKKLLKNYSDKNIQTDEIILDIDKSKSCCIIM